MNVLQLIAEAERRVPAQAPPGVRWKGTTQVTTPHGPHTVAIAARIDRHGHRCEQFWCDDVRVERAVLLRLTCHEVECPHAVQVRAQWLAFHRRSPADAARPGPGTGALMAEIPLAVGRQRFVARPARFPCFTHCPQGAHPPLSIDKTGFDLFEDGACLGGGITEVAGVRQPRIPTVGAAEAFVLARHFETLAAIAKAADSSRLRGRTNDEAD